MRFYFRRRKVHCVSRHVVRQRVLARRRVPRPDFMMRPTRADRSSLLVTTALVSTLLIGGLFAPTPTAAQTTTCSGGPAPGPTPIMEASAAAIICVNNDDRTSNGTSPDAINLSTTGVGSFIDLYNGGVLTAADDGIDTSTTDADSFITIENVGDITAGTFGLDATTAGVNSGIVIDNDGDIVAALNDPTVPPSAADGIYAFTSGGNSPIAIQNSGDITVYGAFVPLPPPDQAYSAGVYDGVYAVSVGGNSGITVVNSGDITTSYGEAIDVRTYGATAPFPIPPDEPVPDDLKVGPTYSPVTIINHGNIYSDDDGIEVCTAGLRDTNCRGGGGNSPVLIKNYGNLNTAYVPLDAVTYGPDSPITFYNYGDVVAGEEGLDAESSGDGSFIEITNHANVEAEGDGISAATSAYDQGHESPITIFNTGDINSGEVGIYASTGQNYESDYSPVAIHTSGKIIGGYHGIYAHTDGIQSPIYIENRGEIIGGENEDGDQVGTCVISDEEPFDRAGICAAAEGDDSDITIVNYGSISAGSGLAIDTEGGATTIINRGIVTGFVDLTEEDDVFENAGTFEAREESDFGDGDDVFNNTGTVHALGQTSFVNLEEFNNSGLISMVDGRPRDVFSIEGPVAFNALSGSRLAVDADLGPPGSKADLLQIDGDVDGKTAVSVNNTNPAGGTLNKEGIPVVEVTGSVGSKDFFLKGGPVDAGFFAYDLFFEPGDPNVFELRSALGGNAFVLPQLTTAMQDLWHSTSDTWFDRTADLRMALYGASLAAPVPADSKLAAAYPAPGYQTVYPGLWARGSFGEVNRDASVKFTSFGPATAHLNRDQRVGDFQAGIDFGTRDVLGSGDAVIFGVLGGFVVSELDYDQLAQSFDLDGGQVGAYVTYLNGGLFIDTLFKADFVDLDPKNTVGFAGSLDAQNFGVRVDSGYRFGGFAPGMFFEPLATIGVVDSEIDNFTQGGNKVGFDDGTSARGRLGLRVGTSFRTAQMTVEPFVIGSVWHEFEDDNQVALVSSGTSFNLADNFEDTWGEVSAGINLFNTAGRTAGFGKIDVVFGDDVDGVGGQIGVRYKW
jgi:outer membrane autotransporter protein